MPLNIGFNISFTTSSQDGGGPPITKRYLLAESGDFVLTEDGDKIILEDS